jgi:hypothetical protein
MSILDAMNCYNLEALKSCGDPETAKFITEHFTRALHSTAPDLTDGQTATLLSKTLGELQQLRRGTVTDTPVRFAHRLDCLNIAGPVPEDQRKVPGTSPDLGARAAAAD